MSSTFWSKSVSSSRLPLHRNAVPGTSGSEIASFFDAHRILEVLVKVIDVLDHAILHAAAHRDVVEEREMLHVLAETDAAGMRTDRDSELRRHEKHRDHFVHSSETAGIDLTVADGLRAPELLEHHPVVAVLSRGDTDGRDRARDSRVAEDIVRVRGLFDPVGLEARQGLHVRYRLVNIPHLVRAHEAP